MFPGVLDIMQSLYRENEYVNTLIYCEILIDFDDN